MSLIYMAKAFKCKLGGTPLTKLVLLKLADNSNDDGICWPSYKHIADQCECSRRSVIIQVKKLVEMGYVEVVEKGNSYQKKSNRYLLTLDDIKPIQAPAAPPMTSEGISPAVNLTSEASAPTSEATAPVTSEASAPQPTTLRTCHRTIDDDVSVREEKIEGDPISEWLFESPGENPYENDFLDQHSRTEFEMHEKFEPHIKAMIRRQFTGMGITNEEIDERLLEYMTATMINGSKRTHQDWSNGFARSVLNFRNKKQRGNGNVGKSAQSGSGKFDAGAEIVKQFKSNYRADEAF